VTRTYIQLYFSTLFRVGIYLTSRESWPVGSCLRVMPCQIHLVEWEEESTEGCYSQRQQQIILPTVPSRFTPIDSSDRLRRRRDGRDGLAPGASLPTTSPKLFLTINNSSSSSSELTTVWTTIVEGEVSGDVVAGAALPPCTSVVSMMTGAAGDAQTTTDVSIGVVSVVSAGDTISGTPIAVVGRIGCYDIVLCIAVVFSNPRYVLVWNMVISPAVCLIVVNAFFFLFLTGSDYVSQITRLSLLYSL